MTQQTALIADIIQSKKSENRYEVQKKMVLIIDFLNKCYHDNLIRKVEISSGDSFQGLFDSPGSAFLYIRMAQMLLYPTKIRAGIGVGTLEYMDKSYGTNLLDGEAYHNAKTALDIVSSTRKEAVCFHIRNSNRILVDSVNVMLNMYYKLRQRFGANSLRISLVNELLNPMSVTGDINYLGNSSHLEIELIQETIEKSFNQRRENREKNFKDFSVLQSSTFEPFIIPKSNLTEREGVRSSNFVLRGIQENVATVIGTSRQNVQKYYSKGVADEREYAASLVNFMNEVVR